MDRSGLSAEPEGKPPSNCSQLLPEFTPKPHRLCNTEACARLTLDYWALFREQRSAAPSGLSQVLDVNPGLVPRAIVVSRLRRSEQCGRHPLRSSICSGHGMQTSFFSNAACRDAGAPSDNGAGKPCSPAPYLFFVLQPLSFVLQPSTFSQASVLADFSAESQTRCVSSPSRKVGVVNVPVSRPVRKSASAWTKVCS